MFGRNRQFKDNAAKCAHTAYSCHVCSVECNQADNSYCIQCDGCEAWIHTNCINMSVDQLNLYSLLSHAQFFCSMCAKDASGRVNFRACLARIASCAPQVFRMRQQAESEQLLLSFYCCVLSQCSQPSSDHVVADDASAVALLSKHSPWLLTKFVPVSVAGDGNCLYGRESLHDQLRLLAAIEVLTHPELYDIHSDGFYAPYKCDSRIMLSDYATFVSDTAQYGSYSDMLTVLSLSSVVQKPIQTRWPVVVHPGEASRADPARGWTRCYDSATNSRALVYCRFRRCCWRCGFSL